MFLYSFAVQPADRHLAGVDRAVAIRLRELAVDELDHQIPLRVARLRLLLRRHVAPFHHLGHLFPHLAVFLDLRVVHHRKEVHVTLLLFVVVAIEAVLLQHGLDVILERHRPFGGARFFRQKARRKRQHGGQNGAMGDQERGGTKRGHQPGKIHAKQPETTTGIRGHLPHLKTRRPGAEVKAAGRPIDRRPIPNMPSLLHKRSPASSKAGFSTFFVF